MTYLDIIIRTFMAIIVGGAMGYEREKKKKPAGFITHTIVCVGACVIAMIQSIIIADMYQLAASNPEYIPMLNSDTGRLIAQVVSGIGFLGAGTIIQTKDVVTGITTAATLWLVACLGIGIGMGYYKMITLVVIIVSTSLFIMKKIQLILLHKRKLRKLIVSFEGEKDMEGFIIERLNSRDIRISNIKHLTQKRKGGILEKKSIYTILVPSYIRTSEIINDINSEDTIVKVAIM